MFVIFIFLLMRATAEEGWYLEYRKVINRVMNSGASSEATTAGINVRLGVGENAHTSGESK